MRHGLTTGLLALALLSISPLVYAGEWKDIPSERAGFKFDSPGLELVCARVRCIFGKYTRQLGGELCSALGSVVQSEFTFFGELLFDIVIV